MKFSIITPSFRSSEWLKLCIASVADQQGASFEHIVQDSCSDDGTQEWLPREPRVRAFIEKDSGMYDAVNRGLRRASGEIMAYLNCDEQYLPGALAAVGDVFQRRPELDIVLADTVVTDSDGGFICCRKSLVPWRLMAWTFVPTITSSIFFHRRVLDQFNLFFDARWRDLGDVTWMQEALQLRLRMALFRRYTSTFADTGENMNLKPNAVREKQRWVRMGPWWARWFSWALLQAHRMRAASHGLYWEKPFAYSVYTRQNPGRRIEVQVAKPTGIWWQRHADAAEQRALKVGERLG
ncbi:MAG TPA: glycosyltransferase [Candidatus Acidoferrum sp.]|nr:glycosyltransferase [Candidatus Acidoferrum sp.]